jgi:exodeoxyribonuclease V gamma subunit
VVCDGLTIEAKLPFSPDGTLTAWRLADPKGKDYITQWINHLVANMNGPTTSIGYYRGKSEDTVKTVTLEPVLDAPTQLAYWVQFYKAILCQPLPCNAVFGMEIIKPRPKSQYSEFHFEALWNGKAEHGGLSGDPYLMLFWPELPNHDDMYQNLAPLFAQIDRARQLDEVEVA